MDPLAVPNSSTQTELLTSADLLDLDASGRCELVEGRVVRLSPTKPQHGNVESYFTHLLCSFVYPRELGQVQGGEVGIYTHRNPDTVRAADILFISHQRLAQATPADFLDIAPELIVEILSPTDRQSEVEKKLREYFAIGVDVALVIDPDGRTVRVYRSPAEVLELQAGDVLTIESVLPGFSAPVAELFNK